MTDVLIDSRGAVSGVVVANRAGRQAVRAKVIVDATDRASVARIARAEFHPVAPGNQVFRRCVAGGEPKSGSDIAARRSGVPIVPQLVVDAARSHGTEPRQSNRVYASVLKEFSVKEEGIRNAVEVIEYELTIPMPDEGFAALAEAEQWARGLTFDPAQVETAEFLFHVPPGSMRGKVQGGDPWPGAGRLSLDVLRPADVRRMYVLGPCADLSRQSAEQLLRPVVLMELGTRIGAAAAPPLAKLLARTIRGVPVSGHAIKTIDDARKFADQGPREGRETGLALRELAIARALFRCGDYQDLGRDTLTDYCQDLRGYFAHHVRVVLDH